ncbi:MAG: substrate-binding domain-containing protein [Longimicrobiales bacterium]
MVRSTSSRFSRWIVRLRLCLGLGIVTSCGGSDAPPRLVFGTTHTVEDSGVLSMLVREYSAEHGADHRLSVVVAGSGEILAMARRGDVDIVLAHAPDEENALVASGRAESRHAVMHNDFVLVGQPSDPAGVGSAITAADALRRIASAHQPFVSRGDDSGTHRREKSLWAEAHIIPGWSGYMEAGAGMADALRIASQRGAYILSDRATFEVLRQELQLSVLHEDARALHNQYSVLVMTDARNRDGARQLAEWLRGTHAQRLISEYRAPASGRPLFVAEEFRAVQQGAEDYHFDDGES